MINQLPDSISLDIHFTDIQEIDDTLTNDEARQILQLIADSGSNEIDIKAWIHYFNCI
jgi:hypothetical protein